MLGFARRAGKVTIGTDLVCRALALSGAKKPCLVLYAGTALSSLPLPKKRRTRSVHCLHAEKKTGSRVCGFFPVTKCLPWSRI